MAAECVTCYALHTRYSCSTFTQLGPVFPQQINLPLT